MLRLLLLISAMHTLTAIAAVHPFENLSGLKRFDKSATLPQQASKLTNQFDIKGVKVGDNVLAQAIQLDAQGGELGRIRGGYRSDKIQFDFTQAYKDTSLNQKLALYFNKDSGFINRINIKYLLKDSYFDIAPIKQQTFNAAVLKYGAPLTMDDAYSMSKQKGNLSLERFINGLLENNTVSPTALAYLREKNISRSAKLVKDEEGYALMHTGFDRCYLWQKDTFNQVLSFCFFDKSGANVNGRGIELDLYNFEIADLIAETPTPNTPLPLTL
ncbi:hypothetical protein [Paraglaciecola sp. 2405UD69-4]|uniref:hypothetical protein n=1 Tax=Paraglaciecola sp. 2405UD69-4 TaxID=3391836 RepID=UPI0039C9CFD0